MSNKEDKFELAKKVIEIVSIFDGCVYGSFVRNVIVPRMYDPKCEISFDDIDVWMKSSYSRDFILEKIRENFRYETDNLTHLTKYKILETNNRNIMFNINLVVSFDYPDEKFDVNFVKFKYSNGVFRCIDFEHLIEKIRNKQATIVKTYIPSQNIEFEKINKDFFNKGWNVLSEQGQSLLSKWIVKNNIHILITYENGHWNYSPNKINESEYKIDVAKKILTLANTYDGKVYGGFVRDVIVPRINDSNCIVTFKDLDIWFCNEEYSEAFINTLTHNFKIEIGNGSFLHLDYNVDVKFTRKQYRIYSQNDSKFLFHIDIITSEKLPVNDFNVNTITYKYIKDEFVKTDSCDLRFITNKIAIMFDDYNPESIKYYERINRIFFSKGWTVKCNNKHLLLSNFITRNELNVTEIYTGFWYNYIPKNTLKFDPAITNRIKITPFLDTWTNDKSKLEDMDKETYDIPIHRKNITIKDSLYNKELDDKQKDDLAKKIELILSKDSIENRIENRFFVSVSTVKRFPCRFLSGAVRSWSKSDVGENTRVFILPLRITGTPQDIKETLELSRAPYTEQEINNYLKDAITKNNYKTTKSKEYKEEIAAFKKIRLIRIEKAEKICIDDSKEDKSKDIMKSIFNTGLDVLNKNLSIENEDLQYVYKLGLDQYRNKFEHIIKEMK